MLPIGGFWQRGGHKGRKVNLGEMRNECDRVHCINSQIINENIILGEKD